MNKKIYPTLYALNSKEFENKLKKIKFSKNIHLDFMDGNFTNNKSINFSTYKKIKNLNNNFEVHIMGYNPLKYIDKIKDFNIKKVLIHVEIFQKFEEGKKTIQKFKKEKIKVSLVINPNTDIRKLYPYLKNNYIASIMFMSVVPGKEGQKFIPYTLKKIKKVLEKYPKTQIQIDGGINDSNIEKIFKKCEGIKIFSIGSNISSSKEPLKNYKILNKKIS